MDSVKANFIRFLGLTALEKGTTVREALEGLEYLDEVDWSQEPGVSQGLEISGLNFTQNEIDCDQCPQCPGCGES